MRRRKTSRRLRLRDDDRYSSTYSYNTEKNAAPSQAAGRRDKFVGGFKFWLVFQLLSECLRLFRSRTDVSGPEGRHNVAHGASRGWATRLATLSFSRGRATELAADCSSFFSVLVGELSAAPPGLTSPANLTLSHGGPHYQQSASPFKAPTRGAPLTLDLSRRSALNGFFQRAGCGGSVRSRRPASLG
jgi:hypothetical protein